ncbi:MAG: hypothetical protein ACRD18_02065 [Terriglobia bacterium]
MKDQSKGIVNWGFAAVLVMVTLPGVQALGAGAWAGQSAQQSPPAQAAQPTQSAQPAQSGQSSQPPQPTPSSPSGQSGQPAPSLRNPQPAPAPASAAPQINPEEKKAYDLITQELDPAKQLALVKDFEKKYPKSVFLSDVYFFGASAEEQQNDAADALTYGQKSLKLGPNNLRSLILVSGLLPLPQALQGTVDQKEQQLTMSEDDANRALQLLARIQAPSTEAADQFAKGKQLIEAQVHAALGMAHLQKAVLAPGPPDAAELAASEQEFKSAVASPQPNPQDYYRLGEVYTRENKLDDAISAFTQSAQLGQGKMIERYANAMVQRLKAQKVKPSAAPAPAPAKH